MSSGQSLRIIPIETFNCVEKARSFVSGAVALLCSVSWEVCFALLDGVFKRDIAALQMCERMLIRE